SRAVLSVPYPASSAFAMSRPAAVQHFANAPTGTVAHAATCWFTGVLLTPMLYQRTYLISAFRSLVFGTISIAFASTLPPTLGYQRAGGVMSVSEDQNGFARSAAGPEPE